MKLASISRYRTELMGLAILWIVFYHTQINFGDSWFLIPLNVVKALGYGGVDLFFFLSGFGLTYGWLQKVYKLSEFYRRRIFRILPTYWLSMFLFGVFHLIILKDFKIRGFVADLFGIGFLSGKNYNNWFIPSIIVCYLIFPLIMYILDRRGNGKRLVPESFLSILFLSSCLPLLLSLVLILTHLDKLLIFSTRLPNFILGIFIGLAHFQNKAQNLKDLRVKFSSLALVLLSGFLSLYLVHFESTPGLNWAYGLWFYPFIILTFPLCLLAANFVAWLDKTLPKNHAFLYAMKCLSFCGKYSLEIYLMHLLVFAVFKVYIVSFLDSSAILIFMSRANLLQYALLTTFSIVLAYWLSKVSQCTDFLLKSLLARRNVL